MLKLFQFVVHFFVNAQQHLHVYLIYANLKNVHLEFLENITQHDAQATLAHGTLVVIVQSPNQNCPYICEEFEQGDIFTHMQAYIRFMNSQRRVYNTMHNSQCSSYSSLWCICLHDVHTLDKKTSPNQPCMVGKITMEMVIIFRWQQSIGAILMAQLKAWWCSQYRCFIPIGYYIGYNQICYGEAHLLLIEPSWVAWVGLFGWYGLQFDLHRMQQCLVWGVVKFEWVAI